MSMNGAESLVQTLLDSGVDTCFANPGTSEMHFVAALDRIPGMRCILGLFENVVTGAADGYGRITGKPAVTLLHCGPGLGNGLANLHNGRRANTTIINCVGDQATHHRPLDAPLTADTEALARTVSGWVRVATDAASVGAHAAAAAQAALTSPGTIATLILPSDTCWNPGGVVAKPLPKPVVPKADPHAIKEAANRLRNGKKTILVLGNSALRDGAMADAYRIAAKFGAKLVAQGSNGLMFRGRGRFPIERMPYAGDAAGAFMKEFDQVILVGAIKPVIFFGYPNKPGTPVRPDADLHVMSRPEHDSGAALAALADELGNPPHITPPDHGPMAEVATGKITVDSFGQSITALLPENCIVVDEAVTFGRTVFPKTHASAPHDFLSVVGGAIGGGMPIATGVAVGAPGRRVINLQADGSAMYTLQSLWTMAREKLDVTVVIMANRKYQILIGELANVGANVGPTAMSMLDLTNPNLDFVHLANGMGVEAARAETIDQFNDLFAAANKRKGPFLIELLT